ncbi:MAG: RlpA-like double-psi beta-barrel domain-containing protein [Thermoleophilaceae bacterium]
MTTGTAYAASTPPAQESADSGVTMSGAGAVRKVRFGQRIELRGRASAAQDVRLEQAPAGGGWRPVATDRAAADGSYRFPVRARVSGAYRAVAGSHASLAHRLKVVARLSGKASRNVKIGRSVRVRGVLKPGLRGRSVRLQLRTRGGWKTVDRARTGRGGRFRAAWRASRAGGYRLRVRFQGDRRNVAVSRVLRGRAYVYRPAGASWYGLGGRTACGYTMNGSIKGVAHRSLPCGTRVRFWYRGHTVVAKVIDRGPFVGGRAWDLTPATKRALGFGSTGTVWSTH